MIELVVHESYGQAAWTTSDEREDQKASRSRLARRVHWLIAKHKISQLEVLTIGPKDEVLPVFSFKEEAEMYVRLRAGTSGEEGWRVRETSVGELTSVLYGPCASVGQVALDPLPEALGGVLDGLLSVRREEFVLALLDEEPPVPRRAVTPTDRSVGWFWPDPRP